MWYSSDHEHFTATSTVFARKPKGSVPHFSPAPLLCWWPSSSPVHGYYEYEYMNNMTPSPCPSRPNLPESVPSSSAAGDWQSLGVLLDPPRSYLRSFLMIQQIKKPHLTPGYGLPALRWKRRCVSLSHVRMSSRMENLTMDIVDGMCTSHCGETLEAWFKRVLTCRHQFTNRMARRLSSAPISLLGLRVLLLLIKMDIRVASTGTSLCLSHRGPPHLVLASLPRPWLPVSCSRLTQRTKAPCQQCTVWPHLRGGFFSVRAGSLQTQ